MYDRPATFEERVRAAGYPKPDPDFYEKTGGTQYKVKDPKGPFSPLFAFLLLFLAMTSLLEPESRGVLIEKRKAEPPDKRCW